MSSIVYPVTGGMEDWAYSGSWEGDSVITQPCDPKTYAGYDHEKTLYTKNYKDALKSIMFLLEISHSKNPSETELGKFSNDDECILGLRKNPFTFFNNKGANLNDLKTECLDAKNDGYVNRVLRLSLSLIDLLIPYISVNAVKVNKHISFSWIVGGSISVEETFLLYDYFEKISDINKENIEGQDDPKVIQKNFLKKRSHVYKGKGIWDHSWSESNGLFNFKLKKRCRGKKNNYIAYIVFAKVDSNWLYQENPMPNLTPQTHIVNLRNHSNYTAQNGNFILKGKEYFKSTLFIKKLK
jgi:hypothetical protein